MMNENLTQRRKERQAFLSFGFAQDKPLRSLRLCVSYFKGE
jgi:hypothetical protein